MFLRWSKKYKFKTKTGAHPFSRMGYSSIYFSKLSKFSISNKKNFSVFNKFINSKILKKTISIFNK